MVHVKYPISVISTFLWVGAVCAISFLEAGLKFRAPGITLELGLGIGKIVFNALNKIEWAFAIAIAAGILVNKGKLLSKIHSFYFIALLILILETVWLIPLLDKRADMILNHQQVQHTSSHLYYIIAEVLKTISLFIFGIIQFK